MDNQQQMLWMDEDFTAPAKPLTWEEKAAQLEQELQQARKELTDMRKDLAAKTVQLSRRDEAAAQEKAAELAASAFEEKNRQLQELSAMMTRLEMSLQQKDEELAEARKLVAVQKKALREAASVAAEAEMSKLQADEASSTAAAQALEQELDKLTQELAAVRTRTQLELEAREAELHSARTQLAAAVAQREAQVTAARSQAEEQWRAEVIRLEAASAQQAAEMEQELLRLKSQMQDYARKAEHTDLHHELAALNKAKVQVQREFEAFKELATQTARQNREEAARLLEENAALRNRLANATANSLLAQQQASAAAASQPRVFAAAKGASAEEEGLLSSVLTALDKRRIGLAPMLIVGSLVVLVLMIALIRAAASARGEHKGLCFLSKLGVNIGPGCGETSMVKQQAEKEIEKMLEQTPRVHDIEVDEGNAGGASRRLMSAAWRALARKASELQHWGSSSSSSAWQQAVVGAGRLRLQRLGA